MPDWTLHRGDALTILHTLPTGSVDAVITDPPYNSGGMTTTQRTGDTARGKYVSGDAQHDLPDFDGDTRDQRGYLAWMSLVLGQCYRLTRESGPLLIFADWRQVPVTSDALQWQVGRGAVSCRGTSPSHAHPRAASVARASTFCGPSKGPVDARRNPVYLPGLVTGSSAPRHQSPAHHAETGRGDGRTDQDLCS